MLFMQQCLRSKVGNIWKKLEKKNICRKHLLSPFGELIFCLCSAQKIQPPLRVSLPMSQHNLSEHRPPVVSPLGVVLSLGPKLFRRSGYKHLQATTRIVPYKARGRALWPTCWEVDGRRVLRTFWTLKQPWHSEQF